MKIYKLKLDDGVVLNGQVHIPNDEGNRHWVEYQAWLGDGNTPDPADPAPVPEVPPPTVYELIDALDAKNRGDTTKWDSIKLRI